MNREELADNVFGMSIAMGWVDTDTEDAHYAELEDACATMDLQHIARTIGRLTGGRAQADDIQRELEWLVG